MNDLNRFEKKRRELIETGRKIFYLSSGNPNEFGLHFPSQILEKAFQKFVKKPTYQPDPKGDRKARQAIADFYKNKDPRNSQWLDAEKIILTSGTSESYFHLFKFLAQPGEEILFPCPSYPLIAEIARLADLKIVLYGLKENADWQIDLDDLKSKINSRTRAIVLISPNNPTGSILHEDTLREVIQIAHTHRLAIVSDEVFSEFIFDGKAFPRIAEIGTRMLGEKRINDLTIFTLSGVSKTFALPGLKLSWIIVNGISSTGIIDQLERSTDAFLSTNQVAQLMLPTILRDGKNFLKKFQQTIEQNRDAATQILRRSAELAFCQPEGGFYLFVKIIPRKSFPMTDEDFVIHLMEKTGIFVHPGYFYDYEKGVHFLISLLPQKKQLKLHLEKLVKTIKDMAGKF